MAQPITNLPIGSKVKDSDTKYYNQPIVWKIIDFNHPGYPSDSVTLLSDKLITLKPFDAKESGGDFYRTIFGNNHYSRSNIRFWLNSNSLPWFQQQHTYDNPPSVSYVNHNPYEGEIGFLANFSNGFRTKLLPTTIISAKPSLDGGGSEQVTDKVFLLSITEVGLSSGSVQEGTPFAFFSSGESREAYPTTEAVNNSTFQDPSLSPDVSWKWQLRTPDTSSEYLLYIIASRGGALSTSDPAIGNNGIRPVLNLPSSLLVSDVPDIDGAYILIFDSQPKVMIPVIGFALSPKPFNLFVGPKTAVPQSAAIIVSVLDPSVSQERKIFIPQTSNATLVVQRLNLRVGPKTVTFQSVPITVEIISPEIIVEQKIVQPPLISVSLYTQQPKILRDSVVVFPQRLPINVSVLNPDVIKGSRTVVPQKLSTNISVLDSNIIRSDVFVTVPSSSISTSLFPVQVVTSVPDGQPAQFYWNFKDDTPGESPVDWNIEVGYQSNVTVTCVVTNDKTLKLEATATGVDPDVEVEIISTHPDLQSVSNVDTAQRFRLNMGSGSAEVSNYLDHPDDGYVSGRLATSSGQASGTIMVEGLTDYSALPIPFLQHDIWYWLRTRFDGTILSLKYWKDGDPEPDWLIQLDDPGRSDHQGLVKLYTNVWDFETTAFIEWDYIGVGINGAEAPMPKVSTPQTINASPLHVELAPSSVIVVRGTDIALTVPSSPILTSLHLVQLIKKRTVKAELSLLFLKSVTPNLSNAPPAILALETANGLVMNENFEYKISGSVAGYKEGVPVVVKYKINDAAPQEITSTVTSNEVSTYFSKLLVYRDKLLWDKDTPVIAVELEENVDHLLTVWIENERGMKIDEKIITFRVVQPTRFEYKISGNVTGFKDGSTVTVKYKVNDSFEQVIITQIVGANDSVRFEKTLDYRDSRLWDGTIDIVGYDLAFDVEHTITIWAEDDQGLRSEDITRTFMVVAIDPPDNDPFENLPPVLSVDTPDYWTLG